MKVTLYKMSVRAEHDEDNSPSIGDEPTCSNVAAAGSVTVNQIFRDFVIAKIVGTNGKDRVGDSTKVEQDCTEHGKSDKKKKKKKKKKKHKSHHKDSSSKHHRHRHRDRLRDSSSESNSSDGSCTKKVKDAVEEKNAPTNHCIKNRDSRQKDDPQELTKKNDICMETSQIGQGFVSRETKDALLKSDTKKCHTTKSSEMNCHYLNQLKCDDRTLCETGTVSSLDKCDTSAKLFADTSHKECQITVDNAHYTSSSSEHPCCFDTLSHISEADHINKIVDSQHSSEATSYSHKEKISVHKHSDETRKFISQDDRREYRVYSNSKQSVGDENISCGAKKEHPGRERRSTRDVSRCDKAVSSRKRSPSSEAMADKCGMASEDGKSDDVVFVKKVSARATLKSSYSRAVSNTEKTNSREQKSSRGSNRNTEVGRGGSKRRYDSVSSDDDSVPTCKSTKDGRLLKESSFILLSDDEVDVLSEEMAEKLHKRLTTSIKKSKQLQAERQSNLAVNLKTYEPPITSDGAELIEEPRCNDVANTQNDVPSTSAYSEIVLPADSGTSCSESVSTYEQTAAKSTALGLFGKKMLKFGLKISEYSAALISKGVRSSPASGEKACYSICCLFMSSNE